MVKEKAYEADGFIFGTPVHYASASGNMTAFMDRLFYSGSKPGELAFYMKPAAAITSARRAGTTATFDQMNKYFTISQMEEIKKGFENGLSVEKVKLYAKPAFNFEQMEQIRLM